MKHDPDAAKFYVGGGVCAKELILEHAGDSVVQHEHCYPHLSLLAKGKVAVSEGPGIQGIVYEAPGAIMMAAGVPHCITALSDDVLWYCLHAVPAELAGEPLTSDRIEPLLTAKE